MNAFPGVPEEEIEFYASRSSGPGGQHVNRRSTRVEARWNVRASPSLTDEQRARILQRLESRISKAGVLRVVAYRERSQARNRERALARLQELVRGALARRKPRKKTAPTAASREARLRVKRQRKRVKALRRRPDIED